MRNTKKDTQVMNLDRNNSLQDRELSEKSEHIVDLLWITIIQELNE